MNETILTPADQAYFGIIDTINMYGDDHVDRTGVGTKRVFGAMFKFDLQRTFPIITCKRAGFKNTLGELLWFFSGSTNVDELTAIRKGCEKWWRPFADEHGDLGPMYGRQLRNYNGQDVDQVRRVLDKIKNERDSRRILMTSYNPVEADLGALYPCHGLLTQFMIDSNDRLHMSTVQRSADVGLGLPHNWISYALMQAMFAMCTDLTPGTLTYYVNDLHIYTDHLEALNNLERVSHAKPWLEIVEKADIDDYTMDDFKLNDYKGCPVLKLDMAI